MRPTKYLALLGAMCIALSLVSCGGRHESAAGTPGKSSVATASASVPTIETNALLSKGAALNRAELQRAAQNAPAGVDVGKTLAKAATTSLITAHRFYNTQTGAHFYTTSETERQNVQNTLPQFVYEGPAFYASGAAAAGLSPVHRFFNGQTGVHFYTISEDERALVQANLPQFAYEGIAYYASQVAGTDLVPLFRFYLSSKGYHFYSNSPSERDNIIATLPQYQFEGIGYYVLGADWGKAKGKLPHSGVTAAQCYQAGSDTLVACSSAGATALNSQQDGHRVAVNPMTYSEVPNPAGGNFARTECVRDNVTGLMWEGKTASGFRAGGNTFTNYDDATQPEKWDGSAFVNPTQAEIDAASNSAGYVNLVNGNALCGYTDWRLPTADELQGIVVYGVAYPGPTINPAWFPNTPNQGIWTGSGRAGDTTRAFYLHFRVGGLFFAERDNSTAIRLVRGGSSPAALACPSTPTAQRFNFNAAGDEVTDQQTGLVWARCSAGLNWSGSACTGSATIHTHEQALQLVQPAHGWRLPNVKELSSIADKGCQGTTIDTVAFPNSQPLTYWSSSPFVGSGVQSAMAVNFGEGSVFGDFILRNDTFAVRLVRTSQ